MSKRKQKVDTSNMFQRGSTWYCRVQINGQRQTRSLRTDDVEEAERARDRLLKEADDLRAGREPEHVPLWEDAVDGFLTSQDGRVKGGALSAKTAARYETSILQLSLALQGNKLSTITTATVLDFVEARRADEKSASTIKNDLTAWSRVMSYAITKGWSATNPAKAFERATYIGHDADELDPPTDVEVESTITEISTWSSDMAALIRWLRETGMRLSEALHVRAEDVHPDGQTVTLRHGVKRNARGLKTRTISLGRAARMLEAMPKKGRLFNGLATDSAVVSTRYGQWCRQRQGRELRTAIAEGREAEKLRRWRLHDLRHAFAIATLIDDDTAVYRLMEHLGHSSVKTTEVYVRFLRGEGAQRRYTRRPDLLGSLTLKQHAKPKMAAA